MKRYLSLFIMFFFFLFSLIFPLDSSAEIDLSEEKKIISYFYDSGDGGVGVATLLKAEGDIISLYNKIHIIYATSYGEDAGRYADHAFYGVPALGGGTETARQSDYGGADFIVSIKRIEFTGDRTSTVTAFNTTGRSANKIKMNISRLDARTSAKSYNLLL